MKNRLFVRVAKVGFVMLFVACIAAEAAEVKVLVGSAFSSTLAELGPQFERATGHQLVIQSGISDALKRSLDIGDALDLAIIPAGLLDDAAKRGKIVTGTRTAIGRVGMAVAARAGAPQARYRFS